LGGSMRLSDTLKRLFDTVGGRYLLDRIDETSNNDMAMRGMLHRAFLFAHINKVAGDYFEFGLWQGRAVLTAHHMKHRFHLDEMKLWGFDSFAGLPEIDDVQDNVWSKGEYACAPEEFRRILTRRGVGEDEYEVVPGYYDRSLTEELHLKLAG